LDSKAEPFYIMRLSTFSNQPHLPKVHHQFVELCDMMKKAYLLGYFKGSSRYW